MTNIHTQTWQKILLSLSQSGPFTVEQRLAYRVVANEALKRMKPLEQCVLKFLYMSRKPTSDTFSPFFMEKPEFKEALKATKTTFADIVAEIQKSREWPPPPKAPPKKVIKKPQPDTRSHRERLLDSSTPMTASICMAIFDLPFNCHTKFIEKSFRNLLKIYHPDYGHVYGENAVAVATARTRMIIEAREYFLKIREERGVR